MEGNWIFAILAICVIILVIYLVGRNLKDKKETERFFNEEIRRKKDIELSDDDEF